MQLFVLWNENGGSFCLRRWLFPAHDDAMEHDAATRIILNPPLHETLVMHFVVTVAKAGRLRNCKTRCNQVVANLWDLILQLHIYLGLNG